MKASSYVSLQSLLRKCAPLLPLLGMASVGICQTPQQHVYATGTPTNNSSAAVISGYDKNSTSGSLTPIPSLSPFPAHAAAPMAVDGQGKFLFVAGPASIAMYAIDAASGALTEVPRSPIDYIPTVNPGVIPSNPLSIATEPTGQYVYVGFQNGDYQTYPNVQSSITPYVIDTSNPSSPTLDLGFQGSLDFDAQPVNLFVEPAGRHLYVALGTGGGSSYAGFDLYDIDGSTGELINLRTVATPDAPSQASAMDPLGRFLFQAYGQYGGWLSSFQIPPADGIVTLTSSVYLGPATFAYTLVVDPSGNFLYVDVGGAPPSFNTYSIDQTTGALAQLSSSTETPFPFGQVTVADPQGPYLYTLLNGSLHGFQVDSTTGAVSELSGSPFSDGSSNYYESGLFITNTNPQASSGPYLELSGSGAFPQTPVGQSASQSIGLSNLGNITMSLTSLAIAGDATSSFSQTNTCTSVLAPNAACQVTLRFTPTSTGALGATLQVVDNAPGSPQTVTLSGVGTSSTPQPQVSLSASSLSFGSQTQGTSGTTQVIALTNTGSTTLHFSGVTLTGSYAKDWTQTNTCTAPLASQGTCSISVTFSPSDNGILSAVVSVTDDAPNSPQAINLYGNAPPAVLLNASANGGSTVATVPAGQTATYDLQALPGPSFTGTITFVCSGVPFGAHCTVPASVAVANGAATPFMVSISTLSPSQAAIFPRPPRQPFASLPPQPGFSLVFIAVLLLFALTLHSRSQTMALPRWLASLTAVLLMTALIFSGIGCGSGGGGSSQLQNPPPPQSAAMPVISPASGTFTAAQSVTITDDTASATIHYTTDGSTPTASSPAYQLAIPLSSLTTLQAMAIAPNYANSGVASATFKFQTPSGTITLTPTATPSGSSKPLPLTPIVLTLNVQ